MKRIYHVWTATNKQTKKITCFFISDITEEESAKKVIRPRTVEFNVSEIADEITQQKRAFETCHLMNGYVSIEPTDKGLEARDRLVKQRKAEDQEPLVSYELMSMAEKETTAVLNKIRNQVNPKLGVMGRILKKLSK